jgi:hypothetical protein
VLPAQEGNPRKIVTDFYEKRDGKPPTKAQVDDALVAIRSDSNKQVGNLTIADVRAWFTDTAPIPEPNVFQQAWESTPSWARWGLAIFGTLGVLGVGFVWIYRSAVQ